MMDLDIRLRTQETMMVALQAIVSYVLSEVAKADPKLAAAIRTGFDHAAISAEVLAMKKSGEGDGRAAASALAVIEEFRQITFDEPG
jgi:hypothetical protein